MKEAPEGVGGAEAPTQDEAAEGRGPSLRTPSAQVYATHVLFTNRQGNIPTFKITGHIQLISISAFWEFWALSQVVIAVIEKKSD